MAKRSFDVDTCSGVELVALLLATGRPTATRVRDGAEDAAALLADLGGFSGLSRATSEELEAQLSSAPRPSRAPRASARRIAAAFELGRRAARDAVAPASVASSADVAAWAATRLVGLDHEELWLLALDTRHRLVSVRRVAQGGGQSCGTTVKEILRVGLRAGASAFLLVHNHPSGDPTPSAEDARMTVEVSRAAEIVGMPLLDHVVVGGERHASLFELGLLQRPARA